MSKKQFTPANYAAMQQARLVEETIYENISIMPLDFEMYPFIPASYASLCYGCTDPRSIKFNPIAEIDDSTCL